MMLDSIPIVALFAATILIVMLPMEGGYQLAGWLLRCPVWRAKQPSKTAPQCPLMPHGGHDA